MREIDIYLKNFSNFQRLHSSFMYKHNPKKIDIKRTRNKAVVVESGLQLLERERSFQFQRPLHGNVCKALKILSKIHFVAKFFFSLLRLQ